MISKDIKKILENKTNFGHMLNFALTPNPIPGKIAKAENINLKSTSGTHYYNPNGSLNYEHIIIKDVDGEHHHFVHDGTYYRRYNKLEDQTYIDKQKIKSIPI